MKVVINDDCGYLSLSLEAFARYCELKTLQSIGLPVTDGWAVDFEHGLARPVNLEALDRSDPALIGVAEELGQKAGAQGTELRIIELPEDAKWHVRTVCGFEFLQLSDALIPAR
ncbi:hypothetical protein [Cupriavidus pauculus]|uniref:Uncharacterized protein n=1 Tax=Cupriavidus pauculus TaxID=82633 RepID=A0A2N5C3F9_9BURK|nr:hypothetical protein [Cupriavidus pauculus]PLP96752.1 hypothetical protein CYJ10_30685 [Cupriavidus pauculus]